MLCNSVDKNRFNAVFHFRYYLMLVISLILFFTATLKAAVIMPHFFSDNMVLQRDAKIPVWGEAAPGEKITVNLGNDIAQTGADANGKWIVRLKPLKAGGPYTLKITGENTIEFSNVLLGDVWVCAGQSNMELAVRGARNSELEIANANYPSIRLFTVDHVANADSTRTDVRGEWQVCNPKNIATFSAVAYFFGRDLQKEINVPIALIDIGWNGTRIEAWTSRNALLQMSSGREEVEQYDRNNKTQDSSALENYYNKLNEFKIEKAKGITTNNISEPEQPRPVRRIPSSVSSLYNYMIYPLLSYRIKGVLWYQGEANTKLEKNAIDYRYYLPNMIKNWRKDWNQGDFPFLFVQLPNLETGDFWALMRESMLQTNLAVKKTGMAVTIDIGNERNIHPSDKQQVGYRLSLLALKIAYKKKNIVCQGPLFKSMKIKDGKVVLSFNNTGTSVSLGKGKLTGFKISGIDKKFFDAEASVAKGKIIVYCDLVKSPVAVRYAWGSNPVHGLYNKELLPASPFRTDDWQH